VFDVAGRPVAARRILVSRQRMMDVFKKMWPEAAANAGGVAQFQIPSHSTIFLD
jgi:hypothetical protein